MRLTAASATDATSGPPAQYPARALGWGQKHEQRTSPDGWDDPLPCRGRDGCAENHLIPDPEIRSFRC